MNPNKQRLLQWLGVAICTSILVLGGVGCSDDGDGGNGFSSNFGDPCDDVDCGDDEICEDGECVFDGDPCDNVECGDDEVCQDGECIADGDPCEGVECDDHEVCSEGECVDEVDEGFACHVPEQLGELSDGESLSVTTDPTGQAEVNSTSCGGADTGGTAVFEFSVDEAMWIDFALTDYEFDLVMEIREDDCADPEAVSDRFECTGIFEDSDGQEGISRFDAEPGVTYYAIIEARHDNEPGEFSFDIDTESMFCAPMDSWHCDGDTRVQCFAGEEEREYECGTGCEDDRCLGDTCDNALEVTGPQTFEGDMPAYNANFDFFPHPECTTEGFGDEGPRTTGQDIVLSMPGLSGGQVIEIDTTGDSTTNFFGVLEECDEEAIQCIAGESQQQVMDWEVPESGDYYVVINQEPPTSGTFHYEVDILD